MPLVGFVRNVCVVFLKRQVAKNKIASNIHPVLQILFHFFIYAFCLQFCNKFSTSTSLFLICSVVTSAMHLALVSDPLLGTQKKFAMELIYILLFTIFPAAWINYMTMRRDVELYIANYINEKQKNQLQAVIQLLPDGVLVVGHNHTPPENSSPQLKNHAENSVYGEEAPSEETK